MQRVDLTGILAALQRADSFLVTTHIHPDGDAIGSLLAMRYLLLALGKSRVTCVSQDPAPPIYARLPGAGNIRPSGIEPPPFDTAVIVDVSQRARIGDVAKLVPQGKPVIIIDHHLETAPEGDIVFCDPTYAAVGEIMVGLFELSGLAMSVEAAECAYVALATDTGGFRFSNTTPRSHRAAARCIESGLDVQAVSARIFDSLSMAKFQLIPRVLSRANFSAGGRIAYSEIGLADMRETSAGHEDADGLVNFIRNVEGVEVAVLFKELPNDVTKVSLRACNGVNCADLLRPFGGGGHAAAAGATLDMPLAAARDAVVHHLQSFLEDRP